MLLKPRKHGMREKVFGLILQLNLLFYMPSTCGCETNPRGMKDRLAFRDIHLLEAQGRRKRIKVIPTLSVDELGLLAWAAINVDLLRQSTSVRQYSPSVLQTEYRCLALDFPVLTSVVEEKKPRIQEKVTASAMLPSSWNLFHTTTEIHLQVTVELFNLHTQAVSASSYRLSFANSSGGMSLFAIEKDRITRHLLSYRLCSR